MRRVWATIIDFSIVVIGFYVIVTFGMGCIGGNRLLRLKLDMGIAMNMFYNFICNIMLSGTTIGKYIMKLRLRREGKNGKITLGFAIGHALLKQFFLMLGWISLVIYLVSNSRMPYDKWLGMSVNELNREKL